MTNKCLSKFNKSQFVKVSVGFARFFLCGRRIRVIKYKQFSKKHRSAKVQTIVVLFVIYLSKKK